MLSIIVMPVIALDLGGTKLAGGIMSDKGELVYSTSSLLENRKGHEVGQLINQTVSDLLYKAGNMGKTPASLGICVPGIVHVKTGRIWAPNIPGWDDYPLLEELQKGLDNKIKISVDSDRACYILGEAWKGNARGCLDAIYLSVGTGIGAGIMVNG
ncbi:MAG TPA: ROK family protein, partial [Chitinophagaceae bacterium]|nr:ROK family protein [Chitinophagaceae bacterium]